MPFESSSPSLGGRDFGGAEAMLWTFLKGVDRARISPHVVFSSQVLSSETWRGSAWEPQSSPRAGCVRALSFGRTIFALAAFLRREQPDVVVNWSSRPRCTAVWPPPGRGCPGGWSGGNTASRPSTWLDRLATCLPTHAMAASSASARAQGRLRPRRRSLRGSPWGRTG